jgi:glycerol 3-phosphatase-2
LQEPAAAAVEVVEARVLALVVAELLELLEEPQPARATAARIVSGRRRTARKDRTGSPAIIRRLATRPPQLTLSPLLEPYDHVLLDLDGCVWVGEAPTRGAPDAIAAIRAAGKRVAFHTNDAKQSSEDFVRKLWSMGIRASLEEVVTVGGAIQHVLAERGQSGRALVLGTRALIRHVGDAGMRIVNGTDQEAEADVVVVSAHEDLRFADLRAATQAVLAGAELIGADRDRHWPMPDGPWPGSGAIVAALEYATGHTARTIGKPQPQLFITALDRLGPGRALVVGDGLGPDLGAAAAAHLDAAIVLTGTATRADAEAAEDPAPVAVAENLYSLVTR